MSRLQESLLRRTNAAVRMTIVPMSFMHFRLSMASPTLSGIPFHTVTVTMREYHSAHQIPYKFLNTCESENLMIINIF